MQNKVQVTADVPNMYDHREVITVAERQLGKYNRKIY
jgi:hypothetical protein